MLHNVCGVVLINVPLSSIGPGHHSADPATQGGGVQRLSSGSGGQSHGRHGCQCQSTKGPFCSYRGRPKVRNKKFSQEKKAFNFFCSHRNAQVRKMTSKFVCVVVEGYEPSRFLHSNKDLLDRALPAIVQLSKDSSQETRYYARKCLNALWPEPDFNQVASRVLKSNLYTQAKEVVEILRMKVSINLPTQFALHHH